MNVVYVLDTHGEEFKSYSWWCSVSQGSDKDIQTYYKWQNSQSVLSKPMSNILVSLAANH